MFTLTVEFVTFNPSNGNYCTDIYRDGKRVYCGSAFSSPDTSLLNAIQEYKVSQDHFQFSK